MTEIEKRMREKERQERKNNIVIKGLDAKGERLVKNGKRVPGK